MESHILELLGSDESSNANLYRNNIQFPKKQYPLNKAKAAKAKKSKRGFLTRQEREPLIADVVQNFSRLEAVLQQGGTDRQVI